MTLKFAALATVAALAVTPALAQDATGDAEAGAKSFNKCQACHVVAAPDGTVLAGRAAKTGPNLYALPGRTAGTQADFNGYGDSIKALGASGFAWNEADFVTYLKDPNAFLKDKLGDNGARSKMAFKVTNATEAANLWAYIASLAPAAEGAAPAATN